MQGQEITFSLFSSNFKVSSRRAVDCWSLWLVSCSSCTIESKTLLSVKECTCTCSIPWCSLCDNPYINTATCSLVSFICCADWTASFSFCLRLLISSWCLRFAVDNSSWTLCTWELSLLLVLMAWLDLVSASCLTSASWCSSDSTCSFREVTAFCRDAYERNSRKEDKWT